MLIEDRGAYEDILSRCRSERSFAFDTEFIRERRYSPQLCLVQISVGGENVAIDPFKVGDLSGLAELLEDASVRKIVHAGQQDMEIFFGGTPRVPRSVCDTQIAAALLGLGESIGYSRLVEEITGEKLGKSHTFTDWSHRPLSKGQIEYALHDVEFLPGIWAKLESDLDGLERRRWLEEELRIYGDPNFYRRDPVTLYRRVKGAGKLDRKELAILRALAVWREGEAEARDKPRTHIVGDEVLVEISRQKPRSADKLQRLRGLHPQLLRRSASEIIGAVDAGLGTPPDKRPQTIDRNVRDSSLGLVVDVLEAFLKARSEVLRIAPSYIATRSELFALAQGQREGGLEDGGGIRTLSGWRRDLVGDDLVGLLEGRYQLAIDPKTASVVVLHADRSETAGRETAGSETAGSGPE